MRQRAAAIAQDWLSSILVEQVAELLLPSHARSTRQLSSQRFNLLGIGLHAEPLQADDCPPLSDQRIQIAAPHSHALGAGERAAISDAISGLGRKDRPPIEIL